MIDPKTLERAKKRIHSQGKTVRQWAEENNFKTLLVYRFLQGTQKGRNGESHRIAVALGVKEEGVSV